MECKYYTENTKEIQEFLFAQGHKWLISGKKLAYLEYPYLGIYADKELSYSPYKINNATYLSNTGLIKKLTPVMNPVKSLRTEKVCITVETQALYDTVWNYLIGLGYKISPSHFHDFQEKKEHEKDGYFFIWVNGFDNPNAILLAGNNNGISFDKQFNASTELGAIIEFFGGEPKEEVKEIKPITKDIRVAIKVGNSQELSKIVQEFLFTKGYGWYSHDQKVFNSDPVKGYKDESSICIAYSSPMKLEYSSSDFYSKRGVPIYCAATQFGEIIKLFEVPPVPKITVKNDSGTDYVAKFQKDRVIFGCAEIANEVFTQLNECLAAKIPPYSKGVTSLTIGRGVFTPQVIKDIVGHPHFNKGE